MEQLITSLINFGGMGTLAAVLLMLHREAIKSFREEMGEERKANRDTNKDLLTTMIAELHRLDGKVTGVCRYPEESRRK